MTLAGTLGVTASLKAHIVFGNANSLLLEGCRSVYYGHSWRKNYDFDYLITCTVIPRFVI
jgi:hypothetical protein